MKCCSNVFIQKCLCEWHLKSELDVIIIIFQTVEYVWIRVSCCTTRRPYWQGKSRFLNIYVCYSLSFHLEINFSPKVSGSFLSFPATCHIVQNPHSSLYDDEEEEERKEQTTSMIVSDDVITPDSNEVWNDLLKCATLT